MIARGGVRAQEVFRLSPRKAIFFTVLIAILLPYYYFVDRPELRLKEIPRGAGKLARPAGRYRCDNGDARRTRKFVTRAAPDGQYKVVEPDGKFVPQDLMKALADLLEGAKTVEVVSTNPNDLAEFGLDKPKGEMILEAGLQEAADKHFLRQ